MKTLVINSGSSSLKYQLIDTTDESVVTKGLIEKIGGDAEYSFVRKDGTKAETKIQARDHKQALAVVMANLQDPANAFISSLSDIEAVGHRVVHGGEEFSAPALIDDRVIECIEGVFDLAPLHNPPNLQGILACREVLPDTPQVAVFDTAFHQTMPEDAYIYALPYEYYEKYGIRRYGFHGTSHRFVTLEAAKFLGKNPEDCNFVTCHLGNGSSIAAVKGGKSIDTSMGLTPLEGVVMGTRCGSIDPAIVIYLMRKENLSIDQIDAVMNKKSGLLGVSGVSNDLRAVTAEAGKDNKRAKVARGLLVKSIRKYIGAYMAELGRVDAIIFTAGIGENDAGVRESCVAGLEGFGIEMDATVNASVRGKLADLSAKGSRTKVLLVPTNEELMIAIETESVVKGK